jgi:hypothetical protein
MKRLIVTHLIEQQPENENHVAFSAMAPDDPHEYTFTMERSDPRTEKMIAHLDRFPEVVTMDIEDGYWERLSREGG